MTKYITFAILVLAIIGIVFISGYVRRQTPTVTMPDITTPKVTMPAVEKKIVKPESGSIIKFEVNGSPIVCSNDCGVSLPATTMGEVITDVYCYCGKGYLELPKISIKFPGKGTGTFSYSGEEFTYFERGNLWYTDEKRHLYGSPGESGGISTWHRITVTRYGEVVEGTFEGTAGIDDAGNYVYTITKGSFSVKR